MISLLGNETSANQLYTGLQAMLADVVPDFELKLKADLAAEINRLKVERNAVILGHNYMEPALFHSIPDYVGDSLDLARRAATTDKDTDVRELKQKFPGVPVVTYVNTYADVKAESDICCTSSNAAAVVESLNAETVIFLPDEYLARNVAKETGRHIIFPTKDPQSASDSELDYQMIGWRGRCEVHEKFTLADITDIRKQFPDVAILAHQECSPEVVAASDYSGSTNSMIKFVEQTKAPRYLLLTECSMGENIAAANPDKEMLRLCSVRCPHMNQITLDNM